MYVARISVISINRACRVDARGEGALLGSRASAGSVERDKGAVASPHEAMATWRGLSLMLSMVR